MTISIELIHNDDIHCVRGLKRIADKSEKPAVSWLPCDAVNAYIVCISKAPVQGIVLHNLLTQLKEQQEQGSAQDLVSKLNVSRDALAGKGITLHAVTEASFRAHAWLTVNEPLPAYVYVWGVAESYSSYVLYVPEGNKEGIVLPATFDYVFERGNLKKKYPANLSHLCIKVQNAGAYCDGGLQYSVTGCQPIPLPRTYITGYDTLDAFRIPLMIHSDQTIVKVNPSPGHESEYVRYKG